MPRKHHKVNRHKDKPTLRTRKHHKQKKEHAETNLEPIREDSKEKIKIDKNACGDYASSTKTQPGVDKGKKSKQKLEKGNILRDLFEKDYVKNVEKSLNNQSVRHHSLEKNDDGFLKRTKLLFRKEKSFNDAIEKVNQSNNITNNVDDIKRENKHKHHSRKTRQKTNNTPDEEKKKAELLKPIKNEKEFKSILKEESVEAKVEKTHKRRHKSKEHSPKTEQPMYGRVQEVIFCQTNQVPYKMENDKNASEIKDLYNRLKKERKHRHRSKEDDNRHRRHSQEDNIRKRSLHQKDVLEQPDHNGLLKSDSTRDGKKINLCRSKEHLHKDNHHKHKEESQISKEEKFKSKNISDISMAPYEKYFAFGKHHHHPTEYCRKHSMKSKESKSVERKENDKHRKGDDDQKHRKRDDEKGKTKAIPEKVEEEKIHQIIEGDLKLYFNKIQTMIDKKLDVILQINKSKHHHRKKEKEVKDKERSISKVKDQKLENTCENKLEENKNGLDQSKRKEDMLDKEEIINEIIKRLKKQECVKNIQDATLAADPVKEKRRVNKRESENKANTSEDTVVSNNVQVYQTSSFPRQTKNDHYADNKPQPRLSQNVAAKIKYSEKTQQFSEKLLTAKDSLDFIRYRYNPPPELVIPVNNLNLSFKKRFRELSKTEISRPCTSMSSCRISAEINLDKNKHYSTIYSASEETIRTKHRDGKRRSSSPERYTERIDINSEQKPKRSRKEEAKKQELDSFRKALSKSPSRQDICTQDPDPFLRQIYFPPENFGQPILTELPQKIRKYHSPHSFAVHGIEPPLLESINISKKRTKDRRLECKTMSIIGIPPEVKVIKEFPVVNQTQTSSRSHRSSITEKDLVEKRKKSKRFKLYYKYSVMDNAQESNEDSSEAKSIVSDSYRVVSDPSEEVYVQEPKNGKKFLVDADIPQYLAPKKWNRISTPRDSHLNNILEEPSNMSDSVESRDYFVPLRGTKEYYCRLLTSSHSEYCFKIDKKPANSNISLQSKDTIDGKYISSEDPKYKFYKQSSRSKSDFKLISKATNAHYVFKSKSDVFIDGNRGKQVIKSIFLEDTHPFVRSRNTNIYKPRRESAFKNVLKEKDFLLTASKGCQTKAQSESKPTEKKQKQFEQIYKTIDALEKNIHSSIQVPPNTIEVSVSPMAVNSKEVKAKQSQFKAIYKTLDTLENRVILEQSDEPPKKVNAAIGSPRKSRRNERVNSILPVSQGHDVAIGNSEVKLHPKAKSPRNRPIKPQSKDQKHYRSTAVSPIRITEQAVNQVANTSPARKVITPKTPVTKPLLARVSIQRKPKQTPENSPLRSRIPKVSECKTEKPCENVAKKSVETSNTSAKPTLLPKDLQEQEAQEKSTTLNNHGQCIRIFRTENRNKSHENKNNNINIIKKEDSKHQELNTQIEKNKIKIKAKDEATTPNSSTKPSSATHESCFHNCIPKNSEAHPIKQLNTMIVNAARYKCRHPIQKKLTEAESTTSSSVSDAIPQATRRSKSLVELSSHKPELNRSKSEIYHIRKTLIYNQNGRLDTKYGSITSNNMEKFTNIPNMRCGSKSHGTCLDHYIGNRSASKLFLTKDYKGAAISAYQKRKLYDQSIREKMKRKFKFSKIDVEPQIFEVRFLSMDKTQSNETILSTLEKPLEQFNIVNKNADKCPLFNKNTNNLKTTERNLLFDDFIENTNCEKADNKIKAEFIEFCKTFPQVTSIFSAHFLKEMKCNCTPSSKNCSTCKTTTHLIETMYESLAHYRASKSSDLNKKKTFKDRNDVEEIFSASINKLSSDSAQLAISSRNVCNNPLECVSQETVPEIHSSLLFQPISCPVLATNSSSFEFLYEKTSSSSNKLASRDTIFANLTKPFEHTFNFNTSSQFNAKTPCFSIVNEEIPNGSIESGYASVKSKSICANSLTNFFKKPSIAALFTPPILPKKNTCSDWFDARKLSLRDLTVDKEVVFKEMAKSCQLYAKKVRENSEKKQNENVEEYQEFSLKLLLSDHGSVLLESKTLSVRSATSELEEINDEDVNEFAKENNNESGFTEEQSHVVTVQNDISEMPQVPYSETGCKLILSNESLKIDNITYLEPHVFQDQTKSILNSKIINNEPMEQTPDSTSLDVSIDSNNSFSSHNDISTQKFFTSLVKIYEKEMDICNSLYNDEEFFEKVLLPAAKNKVKEGKKNKKGIFNRMFGKKLMHEPTEVHLEYNRELDLKIKVSSRLQILASNTKKCFNMLAEAVKVNENIDNELKICGLLRLLERIELGDFQMIQNEKPIDFENEIRTQVLQAFVSVYELCYTEARKYKKRIGNKEITLIRSFVLKHRIGLLSNTDVVAIYIGRGIIKTENQLKAAVSFLIRSQCQDFNFKELEEYCKFIK